MKFSSSALFAAAAAPAYGVDASSASNKDLSSTSAQHAAAAKRGLRHVATSNNDNKVELLKVAEDVVAKQELHKEAAAAADRSLSPLVGCDIGTFAEVCDDYTACNRFRDGRGGHGAP